MDQNIPGPARPVQARNPFSLQHVGHLHALGHRAKSDRHDGFSTLPAAALTFDPIGIEHPTWETSPQGVSAGGFTASSIRTEDIARFGQLYLQQAGIGKSKQLVPESWVAAATSLKTSNGSNPLSDWDQGYCYQFWRCRHGAFRGDGAFGQYCVVMPEQDAVVAITSGVKDMQAVLNLVWDKLLPAMNPSPLPPDDDARTKLEQKLKSLALAPQAGSATAAAAAAAAAKVFGRKYEFPANEPKLESIQLESNAKDGAVTIVAHGHGVEQRLICGHGAWQDGEAAWGPLHRQPVAASGAWTSADTFTGKLCFYETPFIITARLTFNGDELRLSSESNVGFGPTKEAVLVGKAN